MNTNKILLITGVAVVVLVIVWSLYNKGCGSERFGNVPLPLCSTMAAQGGGVTPANLPGNYGVDTGYKVIPCGISNVCSNGALCASNANGPAPFCTNSTDKTCDSSLDWYQFCGPPMGSFSSGCDKNGENCHPQCY